MKVLFDNSLKVAGLALVPWNRLGPENWLPNYKIASLYDWGGADSHDLPDIFTVDSDKVTSKLDRFNTTSLLKTSEFEDLLKTNLSGYDLLTYRPVRIPDSMSSFRFLMSDTVTAQSYENKVEFRSRLKGELAFPEFEISSIAELESVNTPYIYFKDKWGKFIIQDEKMSGSKGSFVITSPGDYDNALSILVRQGTDRRLVISALVEEAVEFSIQGCATNNGVFLGPLQRQIIKHELLCNPSLEGDKFCGAAILKSDQNTDLHNEVQKSAEIIGQHLLKDGYRGVFGVDFLQGQSGKLYPLEVNPRLTGVTPLLNALYSEEHVPFSLLHILELGGYDYQITDKTVNFESEGGMLIVHSLKPDATKVKETLKSGTYSLEDMQIKRQSGQVKLKNLNDNEFIVQNIVAKDMSIKPGGRLAAVYFNRNIIDKNTNKLYNDILNVAQMIQDNIEVI
jgi:hypothetical protein